MMSLDSLQCSCSEWFPLQVRKHVGEAGPVVVLLLDVPCCLSLDHVQTVYIVCLFSGGTRQYSTVGQRAIVGCFFGGGRGDV